MNARFRIALAMAGVAIASQAAAQITFYERQGFEGRSFTTDEPVKNLSRQGFHNHASSVVVRDNRWEVCTGARYIRSALPETASSRRSSREKGRPPRQ